MNGKVHYTHCPVCKSEGINPIIAVKDHSVSGEEFVIWQCNDCTLRFTQDVPDENNINPYYKSPEYISHTNTSKGLLNQLYQKVRRYTLQQKANLIIGYTLQKNGRVLDVGCGVGAFLSTMKEKGWEIEGIEPDEDARKLAKEQFDIEAKEPSAMHSFPDRSFHAITLWHVLEHVHDLHNYIEKLKNLLQENGKLFIAVPNYGSVDADIYKVQWAAYDVPRHLYHFTPKAIETLMNQHGLTILAKKPMWFDSFYISLLSSKYKSGKTNWFSAGLSGLRSNTTALFNKDRCSSIIYIISKR